MDRLYPRLPAIRRIIMLPLAAGILYIAAAAAFPDFEHFINRSVVILILGALLPLPPLYVLALGAIRRNGGAVRTAALSICAMAPFAVIFPWTTTPSPFGVGYGGIGFFTEWLTRYPNFGPINYEVFLGIVCLLSSSFIPAFFCNLAASGKQRLFVMAVLLVIETAVYLPVLIRLDWLLLLCGITGTVAIGPMKIFFLPALVGPLLRLGSVLTMATLFVIDHKDPLFAQNKK